MGSAAVSRSGFGLLRQLANSDAIKNAIVDQDGLELINSAVAVHIGSSGATLPRLICLLLSQASSCLLSASTWYVCSFHVVLCPISQKTFC